MKNISKVEFREVTIGSDWEQLLLMSGCNDHIISNSTYSWWAAYINPSPQKIVCYPNIWFGHKLQHKTTIDLFPPTWTCINHDLVKVYSPG